MDILVLAIINVFIFLALLVIDYSGYISKRAQFFSQIYSSGTGKQKKGNKLIVLFPYRVFLILEQVISRFQKKDDKKGSLQNDFSTQKLVILNVGLIVLAINLNQLFKIDWYITILFGLLIQGILIFFVKKQQVLVRTSIEKKLPEILEIMARVYRVHSDLRIALQEVVNHVPDPVVKAQFKEMLQLSRFGYTVEEAMEYTARKIDSVDFNFVITSIKLNVPMGGDISKLFEHNAKLLRQRTEVKTEIQNLMFQSKISSTVSALLVPIIIIVAFTSSTKYQDVLLYNPSGRLVFFACLFWWLIGVVIIRKNSRIRI